MANNIRSGINVKFSKVIGDGKTLLQEKTAALRTACSAAKTSLYEAGAILDFINQRGLYRLTGEFYSLHQWFNAQNFDASIETIRSYSRAAQVLKTAKIPLQTAIRLKSSPFALAGLSALVEKKPQIGIPMVQKVLDGKLTVLEINNASAEAGVTGRSSSEVKTNKWWHFTHKVNSAQSKMLERAVVLGRKSDKSLSDKDAFFEFLRMYTGGR